jgi:hypothetical protein
MQTWTQINSPDVVSQIKPGSIIAGDPDSPDTGYVVKKITPHYIKAIDNYTQKIIIISPKNEIISGKWWLLV